MNIFASDSYRNALGLSPKIWDENHFDPIKGEDSTPALTSIQSINKIVNTRETILQIGYASEWDTLKHKIDTLENIKHKLEACKSQPLKKNVKATLATLGMLVVLAASVTLIYGCAMGLSSSPSTQLFWISMGGTLVVSATSLALYDTLSLRVSKHFSDEGRTNTWDERLGIFRPLYHLLVGAFVPVIMTYGNQKRLERKLDLIKQEVSENCKQITSEQITGVENAIQMARAKVEVTTAMDKKIIAALTPAQLRDPWFDRLAQERIEYLQSVVNKIKLYVSNSEEAAE